MFNHRFKTGSICHAVLPECKNEQCPNNCDEMFKYADCAIEMMLEKFILQGVKHSELEVKLFGGANMFNTKSNGHMTVGEQNIQAAIDNISKQGLKIIANDVGGMKGRKIYFYTHTGEIYMKSLGKGEI
jgi:chemotaxis protein CheD